MKTRSTRTAVDHAPAVYPAQPCPPPVSDTPGNALLPFPFDSGTAAGATQSDELVDVDGTILTGRDTRSA